MPFLVVLLILAGVTAGQEPTKRRPPNLVIVFCDDLGYGDLGSFGHPTIRTPNLDRMAAEGTRLTEFYVAASVCTPSRGALMTGLLPVRTGLYGNRRRVLFPDSDGGLLDSHQTLPETLRAAHYATACFGKWHLGRHARALPLRHGFDHWFGVPYSNDMDRVAESPKGRAAFEAPQSSYWNVPLYRDDAIIERPAIQETLTRRYVSEALTFIENSKDRPFFVYLAHSMPHVPLFRSAEFVGRSERGLYGDVIEEIDHETGRLLEGLRRLGLAENTLVIFTSDNGPWLPFGIQGGSAGLLRGGKGSTYEGGMRVPAILWRPGTVPAGRIATGIASTLDLHATALAIAEGGGTPPVDSIDLSRFIAGESSSPRNAMPYYRGSDLMAYRHGRYKVHFKTRAGYGQPTAAEHEPPLLYDLLSDPSEAHDLSKRLPKILAQTVAAARAHQKSLSIAPSLLDQ